MKVKAKARSLTSSKSWIIGDAAVVDDDAEEEAGWPDKSKKKGAGGKDWSKFPPPPDAEYQKGQDSTGWGKQGSKDSGKTGGKSGKKASKCSGKSAKDKKPDEWSESDPWKDKAYTKQVWDEYNSQKDPYSADWQAPPAKPKGGSAGSAKGSGDKSKESPAQKIPPYFKRHWKPTGGGQEYVLNYPKQWRLHQGSGDAQCQICGKSTKIADLYKPKNASLKSPYGSEGIEFGACNESCCVDLQDRIIMEDLWGKFEDIDRMLNTNAGKLVAGYKSHWENANPQMAISKFFVLMAGTTRSLAKVMRESGFDAKVHRE